MSSVNVVEANVGIDGAGIAANGQATRAQPVDLAPLDPDRPVRTDSCRQTICCFDAHASVCRSGRDRLVRCRR